jgi:hypothetical protein
MLRHVFDGVSARSTGLLGYHATMEPSFRLQQVCASVLVCVQALVASVATRVMAQRRPGQQPPHPATAGSVCAAATHTAPLAPSPPKNHVHTTKHTTHERT